MSVRVDRLALLEQEMARIALVLSDASFDQYEAAVAAVTEAINGMPDVLPDYEPTLYRITKNTDADSACNTKTGNPGPLPLSA